MSSPHRSSSGKERFYGDESSDLGALLSPALFWRAETTPDGVVSSLALTDERGSALTLTGNAATPFTIDGSFLKPKDVEQSLYIWRNIGLRPRVMRMLWQHVPGVDTTVIMGCSSNATFSAAQNQLHPVWYRNGYSCSIYEGGVARTLQAFTAYPNGYVIPYNRIVRAGLILPKGTDTTALMELPNGGHAAITDANIPTYIGSTVMFQAFRPRAQIAAIMADY